MKIFFGPSGLQLASAGASWRWTCSFQTCPKEKLLLHDQHIFENAQDVPGSRDSNDFSASEQKLPASHQITISQVVVCVGGCGCGA
jgi:hypothetical protein